MGCKNENAGCEKTRAEQTCFDKTFPANLTAPVFGIARGKEPRQTRNCRRRIRKPEVSPFNPILGAIAIGDCERGPPKSCRKRNYNRRNHNNHDCFTKGHKLQRSLAEDANARGSQYALHNVENLAMKRIYERPVRLPGGQAMATDCSYSYIHHWPLARTGELR